MDITAGRYLFVERKEYPRDREMVRRLPNKLREDAHRIREGWLGYSPEDKERTIALFYEVLEPSRISWWDRLRAWGVIAFWRLLYGKQFLYDLASAVSEFHNAISDAIEAENPKYQAYVERCIKEALSGERKVLTDATFKEWFDEMED